MATPQEDRQQEEDKVVEFNIAQMAKLDAVPDVPFSKFAETAERIGVLQNGTVKELDDVYPDHAIDFERRVKEEMAKGTPKPMALKLIFSSLYIPAEFILDKPISALEDPNSDLMSYLGRVVKKEDHAEMIKTPAVRALAVRLEALTSDKAQADIRDRIVDIQREKNGAEIQLAKLDDSSQKLETADTIIGNIDFQITPLVDDSKNSDTKNADIDTFKGAFERQRGYIEAWMTDSSLEALAPGMQDLCRNLLRGLDELQGRNNIDISSEDIKTFVEEKYDPLRNIFDTNRSRINHEQISLRGRIPNLDGKIVDLQGFAGTKIEKNMESKITPLKKQRDETQTKKNKLSERIANKNTILAAEQGEALRQHDRIIKNISALGFEKKNASTNVVELKNTNDLFRTWQSSVKKVLSTLNDLKIRSRTSNLNAILRKFDAIKSIVKRISAEDKLPSELQILCQGFIDAFEREIEPIRESFDSGDSVDRQQIVGFVENRIRIFFEEFNTRLNVLDTSLFKDMESVEDRLSKIDSETQTFQQELVEIDKVVAGFSTEIASPTPELDDIRKKIDSLNAQISKMESVMPTRGILDNASPKIDPVDLFNAEETKTQAEEKVKELHEARKFFGKAVNRQKVLKAHVIFENSLGTHGGQPLISEIKRLKGEIEDLRHASPRGTPVSKELKDARRDKTELEALQTASKSLHGAMKIFAVHVGHMIESGVIHSPDNVDINKILSDLESKNPALDGFVANDLKDAYSELKIFYTPLEHSAGDFHDFKMNFALKITALKKMAKEAKAEFDDMKMADKGNHLTPTLAVKQAIKAILKEQYSDMDDEELGHRATLILTDDVMTMQTLGSYEELAKRGSAELFEGVNEIAIAKLLAMELKEPGSEKVERPFQGYKAEQISNISELEKLVLNDKKFLEKGFIVLAAYEDKFGETDDIRPRRLRKALMTALLRKKYPAAEDYLYIPELKPLVDQAFERELAEGKRKYDAWSEHYAANKPRWDSSLVSKLNKDYDELAEEHDRGDINDHKFTQAKAKLLKKARDGDVHGQVSFAMDSAMASHSSKWLQDFGHKKSVGAKEAGKAVGKMGLDAAVGATGQAAKRTFRFGKFLTAPLWWAVKYPAIGAAKIAALPRHAYNFFVPERWRIKAPFQGVWGKFKADAGRAGETGKSVYSGILSEIKTGALNAIKGRWGQRKLEYKSRAERSKVDLGALKEESEEFAEAAKITPAELPVAEEVDHSDIKAKIDKIVVTEVQAENAARGESATGSK